MSDIKKSLLLMFLVSLFTFVSILASAQVQVPDEILQSLKTGDSKTLSEYFNQNVEMVVLENDNVYSKAQAEQIINKFFSNNSPESFSIMHKGGKEDAQYVIGNLATNRGNFRVYFLLKKNNGKDYIHQFRITDNKLDD
jgi:hypothetical protein